MKQKSHTQFNILWIAVAILLVFVTTMQIGSTGSWLHKDETIKFNVSIVGIDMAVKQTLNKGETGESVVDVIDGGTIILNTNIIEADVAYPINVDVVNGESGLGYYVRYRARAVVNGTTYNINNLITTSFYLNNDGWAYHTADGSSATPTQMAGNSTRVMLGDMTIPATAGAGQLSIGSLQGKHFKLFVEIESNAIGFGS